MVLENKTYVARKIWKLHLYRYKGSAEVPLVLFSVSLRLKGSGMLFQYRPNLLEGVTVASNGPKRTSFKPYPTISKFT